MAQNENKNAPRENKGFQPGKKSYTQNPNIDEMPEKPDRWEKEPSKSTPERNEESVNTPSSQKN